MPISLTTLGRLAATAGFVFALLVAPAAAAEEAGVAKPPKVEFIPVEGRPCLQPILDEAGADLADYRAAESRWLAKTYPGVSATNAETKILIVEGRGGQRERKTVQSETFHLEGIAGPDGVVCFDINLTTIPGDSPE